MAPTPSPLHGSVDCMVRSLNGSAPHPATPTRNLLLRSPILGEGRRQWQAFPFTHLLISPNLREQGLRKHDVCGDQAIDRVLVGVLRRQADDSVKASPL